MTDNDNYERHPQVLADANLLNKTAVFDVLTAAGITQVAVTFDGYGDSGQIEAINAYIGETEVELPESPLTVHEFHFHKGIESLHAVEQPLPLALETLCYGYLSDLHPGWEIDDGSFGDFTFDVATRTIQLEYKERITDVITECDEF